MECGYTSPMKSDPLLEWQRLTETYSRMYDGELLQLAVDSADLTESARQVLDGEMRKRGLRAPGPANSATNDPEGFADPQSESTGNEPNLDLQGDGAAGIFAADQESNPPHEYTWKTVLCEVEDHEVAWQFCEVLRQAGIETWIEGPGGSYSPYSQLDLRNPRILVPADRIDQARQIVARPIPMEIVERSRMQSPEYEPPVCPTCGAGDPVLEGVDPINTWKCDSCGNEWSETAPD